MLDARIQRLIAPLVDRAGQVLARAGISAKAVTLSGLGVAILATATIASQHFSAGLVAIAVCRILDGLDGAVARATRRSDLGGYLDIVADYVFYAGVPLGFALADPASNALPAAALLASFLLTCSSLLAYAALAAKHGVEPEPRRLKSLFFSTGLIEGTETIAFFAAMVLWPTHFPAFAWVCATLCVITALQRSVAALRQFRPTDPKKEKTL
ncbi:MAG: CDP-alcohol phosphatidyltransferase family protein [Steroidobacteraceae bacterium]